MFLLASVVAGLICRNRNFSNIRKIAIIFLISFFTLNIMTFLRTRLSDKSFVDVSIDYIMGSVLHMDYLIEDTALYRKYSCYFGTAAYGGFFTYPLKLIDRILGNPIRISAYDFMAPFVYLPYKGGYLHYNALTPNAYYYYFDSGLVGVVVFSFVAGYISGKSERNLRQKRFINFSVYALMLFYLFFSPLGSQAWKSILPVTFFWCVVLNQIVFK